MKKDQKKLLKPDDRSRPKLYITYDSEYTKDSIALLKEKVRGEKLVIKELAYAFSYHIFLNHNAVLNNDAVVLSGADCGQQFVEHIF